MTSFSRARRKTFYLLLAGLFISTAACGKKAESPSSAPSPSQRAAAPLFTLKDAGGKSVSLAQFKGKPVFLDFWATWCGPCRLSMPSVQKLRGIL